MPKDKSTKAPAAELTALRTWLKAHGVSASDAAAIVNAARASRADVGRDIAAWLKSRPKA